MNFIEVSQMVFLIGVKSKAQREVDKMVNNYLLSDLELTLDSNIDEMKEALSKKDWKKFKAYTESSYEILEVLASNAVNPLPYLNEYFGLNRAYMIEVYKENLDRFYNILVKNIKRETEK